MPNKRLATKASARNQKHFGTEAQTVKLIDWASPKQQEAFEYGPAPLCCSGGFGAAKSYALCLKALYLSDTFPQNRGVIARKVSKELERTTMATFFKICPPSAYDPEFGGRRADSENYLRLARSGSEILWLHLDDPDIEGVIRGLEINWFFIDQAEEIKEEVFDILSSRLGRWDQCRVPDEVMMRDTGCTDLEQARKKWPWKNPMGGILPPVFSMIACNPDTEQHWIWRRFHEDSPDWRDRYSALGYKMVSMTSRENKFLPKQNLDEMLSKDASFVRRFVDAEWGIPEGQIHEIRPESIVPGTPEIVDYIKTRCVLHRTLDHGDAAPTCCVWWAVDRDGNVFAYREYYQPNRLVSDHRKNISELSKGEKYQMQLADPSMFFKTMQKYGGRWSFADEYADRSRTHGFTPENAIDWTPADNDELGTRNLINELLRPQGTGELDRDGTPVPRLHPIRNEMGLWPRLFFIERSGDYPNGCVELIRQTKSQRRERIGTELGKPTFSDERDTSMTDHAYDTLRYFISCRVALPQQKVVKYSSKSFMGVRDNYLRMKRLGQLPGTGVHVGA